MGLLHDIIDETNKPAILLGNGINRVHGTFANWENLLGQLGGVRIQADGLTNTEIYDFIELRTRNIDLKSEVISSLKDFDSTNLGLHQKFLDVVQSKGCPVLTTNFDLALERAGSLDFHKITSSGFTRFYPWSVYSSSYPVNDCLNEFGIWHIHGLLYYKDSIRLGLTDYMGSVEKARKLIHRGDASLFRGKNQSNWHGMETWLHIWFNKPLVIVGLGLEPDEVFIRWLLIERKKYFKQFPDREHKTYFLSTGTDNRLDNFLYNLNIEHIGTNRGYEDLYH